MGLEGIYLDDDRSNDTSRVERVDYNDPQYQGFNFELPLEEQLANQDPTGQVVNDYKYKAKLAALQMKQMQQIADINSSLGKARADFTGQLTQRPTVDALGNPTYTNLQQDIKKIGGEISSQYMQNIQDPLVKEHFKKQFDLEINEQLLSSQTDISAQQRQYLKSSYDIAYDGILAKVLQSTNSPMKPLVQQYSDQLGVAVNLGLFSNVEAAQKVASLQDDMSKVAVQRDLKTYGGVGTKQLLESDPSRYFVDRQDLSNLKAYYDRFNPGLVKSTDTPDQALVALKNDFTSNDGVFTGETIQPKMEYRGGVVKDVVNNEDGSKLVTVSFPSDNNRVKVEAKVEIKADGTEVTKSFANTAKVKKEKQTKKSISTDSEPSMSSSKKQPVDDSFDKEVAKSDAENEKLYNEKKNWPDPISPKIDGTGSSFNDADLSVDEQISLDELKDTNPKAYRSAKSAIDQRRKILEKIGELESAQTLSFTEDQANAPERDQEADTKQMEALLDLKEKVEAKLSSVLNPEDIYIDDAGMPVEFLSKEDKEKNYPVRKRAKNAYDLVAAKEEEDWLNQTVEQKEQHRNWQFERAKVVADLEADIKNGVPSREFLEVSKELLSPEEYFKFHDLIDQQEIARLQEADRLKAVFEHISSGKGTEGIETKDLKAAYEFAVQSLEQEKGGELSNLERAQVLNQLDVELPSYSNDLAAQLLSGDLEQAQDAAAAYAYLAQNSPNVISKIPDEVASMARQFNEKLRLKVPAGQALDELRAQYKQQNTPEFKRLKKNFSKSDYFESLSSQNSYISNSLSNYASVDISPKQIPIDMRNSYTSLYETEYLRNGGNEIQARQYAAKKIAQTYKPTALNGGSLMQYSPESVIPELASDPNLINEMLTEDINMMIPNFSELYGEEFDPSKHIKIESNEITARRLSEGKLPAYTMSLYDKNGAYAGPVTDPNTGAAMYFIPDMTKIKEKTQLKRQAAKERLSAAKTKEKESFTKMDESITNAIP